MNTARELLSANIKLKRKELRISQEKLAELVDVSYQTIHDIEGCRTWVSDKTLQAISKALDIELYELLYPPKTNNLMSEIHPHLIERLHKTMKLDIDHRLDDFFAKLKTRNND